MLKASSGALARASFRVALVSSLAAAALASAACSGGGKTAAPSPSASPKVEAAPSPSSQASPQPTEASLPSALIISNAPVLDRHVYASGERVPAETGIGFLNPTTGDFEAWTAPAAVYTRLSSSPDGQLLFVSLEPSGDRYLVDRRSGVTYRLANFEPWPDAASTARIAGLETRGDGSEELVVVDPGSGVVTRTGAVFSGPDGKNHASEPDGRRVAVVHGVEILLLDVPSATTTLVATASEPTLADGGNAGFAVTELVPSRVGGGPPTQVVSWYDWDGKSIAAPDLSRPKSPDGSLAATSAPVTAFPLGQSMFTPVLSETLVIATDGAVRLQILGGDFAGWMADGRALLLRERGDYVVLDLSGRELRHITAPGACRGGPIPSPSNSSLVATPRGLIDVSTGRELNPGLPDASLVQQLAWLDGGRELEMSWYTPGGKDCGGDGELFAPRVHISAPADPRVVAVNGAGDCLNLRDAPGADAKSLGCYPDHTRGRIVDVELPAPGQPAADPGAHPFGGWRNLVGEPWIHVEMPDGKTGWMNASYLVWP